MRDLGPAFNGRATAIFKWSNTCITSQLSPAGKGGKATCHSYHIQGGLLSTPGTEVASSICLAITGCAFVRAIIAASASLSLLPRAVRVFLLMVSDCFIMALGNSSAPSSLL